MATKTNRRKRASAKATAPAAPSPDVATATGQEPERNGAAIAAEPVALAAASAAVPETTAATPAAEAALAPAGAIEAQPPAAATIGLASNCTVKDATGLKTELLQWLDEPGSVAIDAKSVERIDTSIVQLLCAFVRERAERNLGVTWTGATQPLLDAARMLGVRTLLALPTEAAP
jgi:ABC-type transporter Mla MlaB component